MRAGGRSDADPADLHVLPGAEGAAQEGEERGVGAVALETVEGLLVDVVVLVALGPAREPSLSQRSWSSLIVPSSTSTSLSNSCTIQVPSGSVAHKGSSEADPF
jgi:hypothetical protein